MRMFICTLTLFCLFSQAHAGSLKLLSKDIAAGEMMSKTHEFNGFGCDGKDSSPELSWEGAPEGTKSFALMVYDPDVPTGSVWWHWQIINIPANINKLASGAGAPDGALLPSGSQQIRNDYGIKGFGGACPPKGDGVHRYQFTIHALSVEKLDIPEGASSALVGYMVHANTLEEATLESLYKRD